MSSKKGTESQFDELHGLVTQEWISRVQKKGDCSTADLKGAMEWLKANNVTGLATTGSHLKALADSLTDEDAAFVERLVQ